MKAENYKYFADLLLNTSGLSLGDNKDYLLNARLCPIAEKHGIPDLDALIDKLICGAYIEARSCERFAKLAPHVDNNLGEFYVSLLRSEARHYQDYLTLAESYSDEDIAPRVEYFLTLEEETISTPDPLFRFHSGLPVKQVRHAG